MGLAESSVSTRTVPRFTSAVARGLRESAVIALGIVALVLFVALATYSPDDPGFSFTGAAAAIHNRIGVGVSWLTIIDRLGALTWAGIGSARARGAARRDAAEGRGRRQARKEAFETENKRSALRPPPRIDPPLPVFEKSARVERERQVPLFDPPKASELPPLKLLDDPPPREPLYSPEALEALSRLVEMKLKDFAIDAEVVAVQPGPVVTRFELRPAPGVKASQITALAKDLARALSVLSVRVVEVIPGKSVMGLEIANEKREVVTLGEIIRSRAYDEMHSPLALALGKDIGGQPVVADLSRMPP